MRALVVDDSRAARAILKKLLRENGYEEIIEAENGLEGLVRLKRADDIPDLVLVDWNMPEMDGLEFIKRVRSEDTYSGTLVMMVSSETDTAKVTQALDAGANEYLMKPFESDGLGEKLRLLRPDAD
jgi:two-component system chemotaxis response regulator CheY